MSRQSRNVLIAIALAAILGAIGTARWQTRTAPAAADRLAIGGDLVVSVRGEPRTFNRYAARDQTTIAIADLTQASLLRINHETQEVEPWLADRWTRSADGLVYTLSLRPDIEWSDGQPFTADDVRFSFEAAYDEKSAGPLTDSLLVGGKPLRVDAPNPHTVVLTFPSPFAPGLRLLDSVPILPRHKLGAALKAGTFARAWSVSTPPTEVVGLGPFMLREYVAGQRIVFARNPHYWRRDAHGFPLPYLDRVTFEIVPEQNSEILRLDAGELDALLQEVPAEYYATVKRAADARRLVLHDLGVGLDVDSFWINLKPGAFRGDPRERWLQRDELRRAISLTVDRQVFADTVFLGAGVPVFGPITPANRKWYRADATRPAHDPAKAATLLASIGLTHRNRDGLLEDAAGRPARFTLITTKGVAPLERGAAVIRDALKPLGLAVDVVTLEQAAVIQRFLSGTYDAVYFPVFATDTDPATNLDFWLSSGSAHVWNMSQPAPATEWERRIDQLMAKQAATTDEQERVRLFADVQQIFADHEPVVNFVAPRIFVATSSRVRNARPAVQRPQVLWSADTLAVAAGARPTH